jgi:hypothetical protein
MPSVWLRLLQVATQQKAHASKPTIDGLLQVRRMPRKGPACAEMKREDMLATKMKILLLSIEPPDELGLCASST